MGKPVDLVQGTLDLLILKADRRRRRCTAGRSRSASISCSQDVLRVQQGSLYPALQRLEREGWITAEWGASENNRRARFYSLTQSRAQTSGARAGGLGAAVRRHCARAANGVTAMRCWLESRRRSVAGSGLDALDAEVSEELRFHLERQIEANIEAGMTPDEARRAAHLAIGSIEAVREESRAGRPGALRASDRPRPGVRDATASPGAGLCGHQRARRRARHRHYDRHLQRRLRRHAAAAAVPRARPARGTLDAGFRTPRSARGSIPPTIATCAAATASSKTSRSPARRRTST